MRRGNRRERESRKNYAEGLALAVLSGFFALTGLNCHYMAFPHLRG
jgi:hypothetical protein